MAGIKVSPKIKHVSEFQGKWRVNMVKLNSDCCNTRTVQQVSVSLKPVSSSLSLSLSLSISPCHSSTSTHCQTCCGLRLLFLLLLCFHPRLGRGRVAMAEDWRSGWLLSLFCWIGPGLVPGEAGGAVRSSLRAGGHGGVRGGRGRGAQVSDSRGWCTLPPGGCARRVLGGTNN